MKTMSELLPEILPDDPLPLLAQWLSEALEKKLTPNPDAITLATVNERRDPVARIVLCRGLNAQAGYLVFYTNYLSDKGRQLATRYRAAAVFHWDALGRQARVTGSVLRSPPEESDAYFASRPRESCIGAWASDQSRPIGSRAELLQKVAAAEERFRGSDDVPRPEHWGGYRLWFDTVELWMQGPARVHDRARWSRMLQAHGDHFHASAWRATRLQP
jgi:pyridoxamine 5'-phosphate oxidase